MSQKVIIASDSTTDLGQELIKRYNIVILPLGINLGGKSYFDGVDITPDDIYDIYEKTGELPKTAAANIEDFNQFFKKLTADGSSVVFFSISSCMSSTYTNARISSQEFENVHVVDTQNLSTGGGLLVVKAAEMAAEGKSAEEIAATCEELVPRVSASFIIDNLEFLHKGGRCSAVAALGANLLSIKPCIAVKGGKMVVAKKYRGSFASVLQKYIAEQIGDGSNIELEHVFVTHAGCDKEICDACIEAVKAAAPFKEVFFTRAGCTVSSHCGRNTLGVLFICKTPVE